MNFDTNRLAEGKPEISDMIENAEIAGYNIIKCIMNKRNKRVAAITTSIGGFEVIREGGFVERGFSYAYPDKKDNVWLFILDTPKNREKIKRTLASNVFTIADATIKAELLKECEAEGIQTVHKAPRPAFEKFSRREVTLTKTIDDKDVEVLELKRKLAEAEADKLKLEEQAEKSAAFRESKDTPVEVETPVLDENGEVDYVAEEVEVVKTANPAVLVKKPKAGKKLSGVKAKPKAKK